ncbi:MAG: phenylalanine--tRNA ligase subunit beta [bacterium]|nr:phenylalanine--tRNA ligase subunit beta [bacterium]
MKISLNWLKDFVEFKKDLSVEEIAWRLTEAAAEVERIHHQGRELERVVVGEVLEFKKHPEADRLFVGKVRISSKEVIQVIFADKAVVKKGDKVPTAIAPVKLHGGEITRTKFRGVLSEGMLCLDSELKSGLQEVLTIFPKSTKIGTEVTKLLPLEDVVFEIDNHSITHRADLFSHYGFARECVALGLAKWKKRYPDYNPNKMMGKRKLPFSVNFESKEMTSSYHGTIVENLDCRPSPQWMQVRLAACGIRAINALVDITNFVMLEAGAPLHAFDRRAISGDTFLFRFAKKGETMITLDGKEQKLIDNVMIGETNGKIIDLLGIMGGENSEVVADTTSVYFHMDLCNPVYIRKAMIGLGHRTDAGTMYEKGLNPELSRLGICRCLELVKEVFPHAKFDYQMFIKENFRKGNQVVELSEEKMNRHLGIVIPLPTAKKILEDLGCKVIKTKGGLKVTVPCWRKNSLQIDVDLIEEVSRINGYSNIPALPPSIQLATPTKDHKREINRGIQNYFVGKGFLEEANYSFLSEDLLKKLAVSDYSSLIELANPVSEDFRFMRPSFLPYLLNNLSRNQLLRHQDWKTFEMNTSYQRKEQEILELYRVTAVISAADGDSFLLAKGEAERLFSQLSLPIVMEASESECGYPGRVLKITSGGRVMGYCYELHPFLQENFKLKRSAAIIDLDLDQIYHMKPLRIYYSEINRNPEARLDISVVVSSDTQMSEVEKIISLVGKDTLKRTELKDVYQGKSLGDGKKSFTFSLTYQHPERTLEEKEIQAILDQLIKKLEGAGGVVRR